MRLARVPAALSLATALVLGACASPPVYRAPAAPMHQDHWQADSTWQPAQPADQASRGDWWTLFGDRVLDGLEVRIDTGSNDLAIALSRLQQARDYELQARSLQVPSVDAGGAVSNNRQSDHRPLRGANQPDVFEANTIGLSLGYELDLWGRVSSLVAASQAQTQAVEADLASVRLSLQARLAEQYLTLRAADAQIRLLEDTVQAYGKALTLTDNRHRGGIASGIDVERARTQLAGAQVALSDLRAQRAAYEHAIAALIGEAPQEFRLAPAPRDIAPPAIPLLMPSQLLQRRPDIAAAERRVAAANAQVGVARAAFFPVISLGPAAGFQNTGGAGWLTAPNSFWSLGPQFSYNLFDGGLRRAQLAQARAALDEAGAAYRATVLQAFEQVQDELSRLESLRTGLPQAESGARAADNALRMVLSRYRDGAVNYIEVVYAQTADLQAQRQLLDLRYRQLLSGVDLVRALGGGWQRGTAAASGAVRDGHS